MLQYPELNSKSANPMVGDARSEMSAEKDAIRRSYLRAHASEFALVMFSRSTCGYCRVQWPIIQRFQAEMGWKVTLMDLDRTSTRLNSSHKCAQRMPSSACT